MAKIVREYKDARGLLPIRICMLGAPATGKSYLASQVCEHYKLHHIKIADVIREGVEQLVCGSLSVYQYCVLLYALALLWVFNVMQHYMPNAKLG